MRDRMQNKVFIESDLKEKYKTRIYTQNIHINVKSDHVISIQDENLNSPSKTFPSTNHNNANLLTFIADNDQERFVLRCMSHRLM